MQENIGITEEFSIRMKVAYSMMHLKSANYLTQKARAIEEKYNITNDVSERDEYEIYCLNAILSSVSFLESHINEFFCDVRDDWPGITKKLNPDVVKTMQNLWDFGIPRTASYPILKKYGVALSLSNKDAFDTGSRLYQDISNLVQLRNALIHFESELIDITGEHELAEKKVNNNSTALTLEKRLSSSFKANPYYSKGNLFFPQRCISYGCASWALRNAVTFTDLFSAKMEIPISYDHIRSELISL